MHPIAQWMLKMMKNYSYLLNPTSMQKRRKNVANDRISSSNSIISREILTSAAPNATRNQFVMKKKVILERLEKCFYYTFKSIIFSTQQQI